MVLDVLGNDSGSAKSLFSIDDGNGNRNLTDNDLLSGIPAASGKPPRAAIASPSWAARSRSTSATI